MSLQHDYTGHRLVIVLLRLLQSIYHILEVFIPLPVPTFGLEVSLFKSQLQTLTFESLLCVVL